MDEKKSVKFFIKTFGCQMNVDDSEETARLLRGLGMTEAAREDEADLIHVNTCSVRRKAEDKFFSYLGRQRERKLERPLVLGVSGCIPERTDLKARLPFVDYVTGSRRPADYLPELAGVLHEKFPGLNGAPAPEGPISPFAYHTVIRGCSNFCAYCVVPHVRGPEASLPPEEIFEGVRAKAAGGAKEITLLGQNVLAYGYDLEPKKHLLDIIRMIHELPGLVWIRFVTSHPAWVREEFLEGIAALPKVCGHFHVPFQSGDDEVLRRMNRGYTSAEYVATVEMIRTYYPKAGITADAIVGFPGETEAQFENTLRLVEEIRIDSIYSFKYSTREGTAAADGPDDVPEEEKKRRLAALNELQDGVSRGINEALIGKTLEVMVDGVREAGARFQGRTRTNKMTDFTAAAEFKAGDVVSVKITGATPHGLQGMAEYQQAAESGQQAGMVKD